MFDGYTRKAVFPLVGMVALGWLLVIIGFGIETNQIIYTPHGQLTPMSASEPFRYSWWIVILITPFMLIMAVVQAAIDNKRLAMNIIGAITTFLSAVFLTALGYLLSYYPNDISTTEKIYGITVDSSALQFSGALIAAIFWVSLTCVSHFYEREGDLVTG